MKRRVKRVLILFATVVALCAAVFFGARYGWRLAGFFFCQTARIESVSVETDCAVYMKSGDNEYQKEIYNVKISALP